MTRYRLWAALLGVLLAGTPVTAATIDRYQGADELAARVDQLLAQTWKQANVTPARPADDAEWLRRVYLDVAGRIPSVTEARSFLADCRADKRQRLVETLLAEPRYPTRFASVWRSLLLPEVDANIQLRLGGPVFEGWLRDWLASGRGLDWMVRELLTATAQPGDRGAPNALGVFYAAKENKPEELAATASRLFLGINLGCAQCHNHPFAAWKRDQFWSFAAFFSSLQGRPRDRESREPRRDRPQRGELTIPGTEKVVQATYLDGKKPDIAAGAQPRQMLADWMTASDNPYFARAAVNRLWAHFFGTGLTEPLDEMVGTDSVPSQPAVLDELARGFAAQKYDLRWLVRVITATRAYQLSSARSHASQDDPHLFARMAVRGLSGEQLFDSLAQATGFKDEVPGGRERILLGLGAARSEFLTKFATGTDRPVEAQTSILQALTLMNGRLMTAATNVRRSEMLQAVVDAPFLDVPAKIETLYLATLSRKPTAREMARLTRHVEAGVDSQTSGSLGSKQAEALADVFWALLNSAEFVLEH